MVQKTLTLSEEANIKIKAAEKTTRKRKYTKRKPKTVTIQTAIPQHEPGAKLDQGKPRIGLVLNDFAHALVEISKVGTMGANKYTEHGWLTVPDGLNRYTDAMFRHHFQDVIEGKLDEESQLAHLAHRAWNDLATLELYLRKHKKGKNEIT